MPSVKTQGSSLFFVSAPTVATKLVCNGISGISATREQIETTDLESSSRTYVAGLASPGTASFEIQFDPSSAAHTALHALYTAGTTCEWALGWSDGTTVPTVAASVMTCPTTRSWLKFTGFVTDLTFDFSQNGVVKANVSLQVNNFPTLIAKV